MSYISFSFFILLTILAVVYFVMPQKFRYIVLLFFSGIFIYFAGGLHSVVFIYATTVFVYLSAIGLYKSSKPVLRKLLLAGSIIVIVGILWGIKYVAHASFMPEIVRSIAVPIGISFYTLQMIAYLVDVYRGQIQAERSFLKYVLYVTWFPHILQGPIARYDKLSKTLYEGAGFDYDRVCKGLQLMIWGIAQKLIIADRAAIVVGEVFRNYGRYGGVQVLYAAVLYAIELYADFCGCVNISIGVSEIFGIRLDSNFIQPYMAVSVKDFWRRWHVSLSIWLRDYVYIPLGGNRKGTFRKYVNLMVTFVISGIWHGVGNRFIVWGGLHGAYQIVGSITQPYRNKLVAKLHINEDNKLLHAFRVVMTFIWVDIAWVFFRADSISHACRLLLAIVNKWNIWALFDEELYALGIDRRETWLLFIFIVIMFYVDHLHEKKVAIREKVAGFSIVARFSIYLALLLAVFVFGKYGFGFNANDFIYMSF